MRHREHWVRRLEVAVLLVGATLRVWQFASNAALRVDELALARNILDRPLRDLLWVPLDYDQVAPWGFLALEKFAVLVFGSSEAALRLVPFVASLASLLIFRQLANRVLSATGVLIGLTIFACGPPFLLYAAQVKQYSVDLAFVLLLTDRALAVQLGGLQRRDLLRFVSFVIVATCFSHAAVLAAAGLSAALALRAALAGDVRNLRQLAVPIACCAAACVGAALVATLGISAATHDYMQAYWFQGFPPRVTAPVAVILWLRDRNYELFGLEGLGYPLPAVTGALCGAGFIVLWTRHRDVALALLGPVAVTFGAAVAGLYPFRERLILFLLPSLVIAAAEALDFVRQRLAQWLPPAGSAAVLVAVAPVLMASVAAPRPLSGDDIRPLVEYLGSHRQQGDAVYVEYAAQRALEYYGPRYGLQPDAYGVGGCHRGEAQGYLREVDRYRGRPRFWVLFGAIMPQFDERADIVGYLERIGAERNRVPPTFSRSRAGRQPPSLHLFDLSDETRLRSASVETFQLPARAPATPQYNCEHGPAVVARRVR